MVWLLILNIQRRIQLLYFSTHYLYSQMDARFLRDDKMVAIVSIGETFVMGPLCIIIALLYKSSKQEHNVSIKIILLSY